MRHLEVLEELKTKLELDNNVLAVLVFGSVASRTHHEKSDIDLYIIYKYFQPGFTFTTDEVKGIKIGYSRWSLAYLKEKVSHSPYRMYIFAHAKLLFGGGSTRYMQQELLDYFDSHPELQRVWDKLNTNYQKEKEKYGSGKTNIFTVYDELEKRYA